MEGRARRAMELIVMAEVRGICPSNQREAHVNAARAVLCEEFNDVRLYWRDITGVLGPFSELVAKGPGGDFDVCTFSQAGGRFEL